MNTAGSIWPPMPMHHSETAGLAIATFACTEHFLVQLRTAELGEVTLYFLLTTQTMRGRALLNRTYFTELIKFKSSTVSQPGIRIKPYFLLANVCVTF